MKREKIPFKKAKLQAGSFVRIKRKLKTFDKGSQQAKWSKEVFSIAQVIHRRPYPVYVIKDLKSDREIDGKFYERELQAIGVPEKTPVKITQRPNLFHANKLIKTKTIIGKSRFIDAQSEREKLKENNYNDIVMSMFSRYLNK